MVDGYHHGDLRSALLLRAATVVAQSGAQSVSLRALAQAEGVSHTAPRHHFGSRDGLLTALAAQGFRALAQALRVVREAGGSFIEIGVAYVRFADEHPGPFAVMFDADVLLADDPDLRAAQTAAFNEIRAGVDSLAAPEAKQDMAAATVAGWSMMHGLVVLHRAGALQTSHVAQHLADPDVLDLAARMAQMLYGSPATGQT